MLFLLAAYILVGSGFEYCSQDALEKISSPLVEQLNELFNP